MTLDDFRAALEARGGHADVWLVYIEDIVKTMAGEGFHLETIPTTWPSC